MVILIMKDANRLKAMKYCWAKKRDASSKEVVNPRQSGNIPKARRQEGYEPGIAHKGKGKVMKKSRSQRRRRR